MRGIAALVVLAIHSFPGERCLLNAFVAVDFFFILSGFVICHAYGEKLARGMTVRDYLVRRISRLYPLMFIGVLLGAPLLAHLTMTHPNAFTMRDFAVVIVSNGFMLPYLTAKHVPLWGVFPTNLPLWSLAFEVLASATFPLLLRLNRISLQKFCVGWLAILFVSAFVRGIASHRNIFDMDAGWYIDSFLGGFPRVFFGFSCGMLLYRLRPSATSHIKSVSPYLIYICLLIMLMVPVTLKGLYPLVATAILAPLLVWFGSFSPCNSHITARSSEFLGWLSYPLYCVHMPILLLVPSIYKRIALFSRLGIPEKVAAVVLALLVAVIAGMLNDKLQLQRRLTTFLTVLIRVYAHVSEILTRADDQPERGPSSLSIAELADPSRTRQTSIKRP